MKFVINGYINGIGEVVRVCEGDSEAHVLSKITALDIYKGGFVRFSLQEVEEFPADLNINCPKCDYGFTDPSKVIDLG